MMADPMCLNDDCDRRKHCRRHPESGTVPGEWQSWAIMGFNEEICSDFLPTQDTVKALIDLVKGSE